MPDYGAAAAIGHDAPRKNDPTMLTEDPVSDRFRIQYQQTPRGQQKLGAALKHPLGLRLQYLEQHPGEPLAWIRLARTVRQVEELLIRARQRTTTKQEDQLFGELRELGRQATDLLATLEQPGRGDPIKAASCIPCAGSSNCEHCFQGYTIDEQPCRHCLGTGACQRCSAPERKTLWQHLEDDSL